MKYLNLYLRAIVLCLISPALSAVDGVLEISQTCAVQLGCFSGDTPGYPVTIDGSAGNSYRLTSNLQVSDTDTNVIELTVGSVSIDLNGFNISSTTCSLTGGTACPPVSGSGIGVISQNPNQSIRNGSIIGMGGNGIWVPGGYATVKNVKVNFNRLNGVHTGPNSIVNNCTTDNNGALGIQANGNSVVTGNSSNQNGQAGILASHGSVIRNNSASSNGGEGILTFDGSVVSGNTVRQNALDGVIAISGTLILENSATRNGGIGINAGPGSSIKDNTVLNNDGLGINLQPGATFQGNTLVDNGDETNSGQILGGVNMGGNYCQDAVCP